MKIDYKDHYDEGYFTGKKTYKDAAGNEHTYHGPSLTWGHFDKIAGVLAGLLPKGTLLDVGSSAGDLAARLMKRGFDSYGIEISEYAVENCVPEMRGRVALADITYCPWTLLGYQTQPDGFPLTFPEKFNILISTDLLEHIYAEDLDKTFDWMLSKANMFFFCVATTQPPASSLREPNKYEFVAKKGEPIPPEWEATAVSGHVNVRSSRWWIKYFQSKGLEIDWQRMYLFQMRRETDKAWRDTGGWNMGCTFFLEKK